MDPRAYVVADLHVDYWDDSFPNPYPCGTRRHHPLVWGKPNGEDAVLVVAGDVSDDMDTTVQYISSLTTFYNEVLFIDGNHESCVSYPDLLSDSDISSKVRATHNANIHFLADGPFTKDGIAYVGRCGWWDYVKEAEKENEEYFAEWMPHLDSSRLIPSDSVSRKRRSQGCRRLRGYSPRFDQDGELQRCRTHHSRDSHDTSQKVLQ